MLAARLALPVLCAVLLSGAGAVAQSNATSAGFPNPRQSKYNYAEPLHKAFIFFWTQRSGLLPYQRLAWRGDSCGSCLGPNGEDLRGGYYEAGGSYLKIGLQENFVVTQLAWAVVEGRAGLQKAGQLQEAQDAVRWGADYVKNCWNSKMKSYVAFFGNKYTQLNDYFGPPEEYDLWAPDGGHQPSYYLSRTDPGSEILGEGAAALAASAIVFQSTDANYSAALLATAQELYYEAKTYQGSYMKSGNPGIRFHVDLYPSSGYKDELCWAAIWLYKATNNESYAADAKALFEEAMLGDAGASYTIFGWNFKGNGISVLMAELFPTVTRYHEATQTYFNEFLTKQVPTTANGLPYPYGGYAALRTAAATANLMFIYADLLKNTTMQLSYAQNITNYGIYQMNFILGDGGNRSWIVGYGKNAPQQPFHKSSWTSYIYYPTRGKTANEQANDFKYTNAPNRFVVYGALVGGPGDYSGVTFNDTRANYTSTEVSLDYNSALIGPLAYLVEYFTTNQTPFSDCGLDLGWGFKNATRDAQPIYPIKDCMHQCCVNGTANSTLALAVNTTKPIPMRQAASVPALAPAVRLEQSKQAGSVSVSSLNNSTMP